MQPNDLTLNYIIMKTVKLLAAVIALFVLGSCSHTVYPTMSLYNNYNSQMRSKEELSIKSKVNVYFSEKQIKGDFEILSVNTYKPFTLIPLNYFFVKKMNKKFLSKAVKKAYEEGGNAVLVQGPGSFFVLNLKDWVADDAMASSFVNPIFDKTLSDLVKSGKLSSMKRSERVRKENAFVDEIESNLDNMVTREEVEAVREKIKVLSDYNLTLKSPKKSFNKLIKKGMKKCNSVEKRIKRAETKK